MKLESIAEMWNDFWGCIEPSGVARNSPEYVEIRRAFYSASFRIICKIKDCVNEGVPADRAVEFFESLYRECVAFHALLVAGKA